MLALANPGLGVLPYNGGAAPVPRTAGPRL